ncbi:MAG: transglycosylase domain-containing protein [Xanthobacteraceae bacterium]
MGRKGRARRKPAVDATAVEVRLRPQDRLGSASEDEAAPEPRQAPRTRGERTPAAERKTRRPRAPRGETETPRRTRQKRGGKSGDKGGGRTGGFVVKRILYWGAVLALWMLIGGLGVVVWVAAHLPPIQSLEIPKRPPSIQIVDLNGRVLANRGEMGGASIPLKELPAYLPKAFIAIEDHRFFSHHGVDPVGVGRAVVANLLHRGVAQGGSTITQQLAKNLFLSPERTMMRKLQEVVLALWLERHYSKAQILELYLNRVYFGSGAYGVEAAAQRYFGKSARQVTLAEAALLGGLVKSPSRLAPTRNFDGAQRRAEIVLTAMQDEGFVSGDMVKVAMANPPQVVHGGGGSANYVADWIMDLLDDLIGRVEEDIVVETSIDPVLQAAAEKALVDELAAKGDKFGVAQGALVAMTPEGAIRALVGGKDYAESQYNRAVAARRQPGSAFKPFVYLAALEHGLTPDTVREDRPLDVKGWRPENFGHQYYGPVTLTQALANSLNTVAVRLALEVGPRAVVKTAHRLGITSKLEPNASIALGTSEVSVVELVSAYAPFANGGMAIVPHVVERVRAANGKALYAHMPQSFGRIIDAHNAAMLNMMLQQTLVNGTAHNADLPGWPAAGKTGTSQDFRDAWFIGYTAHLVTGVWLGNDDGAPTKKTTGGGLPVEIWSRFMKAAHQGVPVAGLPGLGGGMQIAMPAPVTAPTPPASIPPPRAADQPIRPEPAGGGLDGWLIDRLFGRH